MPKPIEVVRGIGGCLLGAYRGAVTGFIGGVLTICTRILLHEPDSSPPSDINISTGGKSLQEIMECFTDGGSQCVDAKAVTDFTDFATPIIIGTATCAVAGSILGSIYAGVQNKRHRNDFINITPTIIEGKPWNF